MQFSFRFFFMLLVRIQVVHPYSCTDPATAWKSYRFILSPRLDFHVINNLSITDYTLLMRILTLLSIDEILLSRYGNWSTNFSGFFLFPTHELYKRSRGDQCFLLLASYCAAEIRFEQVYLQEAVAYLCDLLLQIVLHEKLYKTLIC